ncbi:MAG: FAD:protein FMN transferase [Oscillospiraceae bacterium]|nr:FAD:protein FMN transferase [Oscillospiraceae bacterium]
MKRLIRKIISVMLIGLCLGGCTAPAQVQHDGGSDGDKTAELTRFEATYLDLFDTVTTLKGYAADRDEFDAEADRIYESLLNHYRLFDIYTAYDGVNNLKTVNDMAGISPVKVDPEIIALLELGKEICEKTGGKTDITLGAVLSLWHDSRESGTEDPEHAAVPDFSALREAKTHTGFELLEINRENGTVYLTDPQASLDVGAIAKGYAAERAMQDAPDSYILSVGGNVRTSGSKPDGSPWVVGVQDPDSPEGGSLQRLCIDEASVVTSGDYQRYYTVDGVRYHHLIDPDTLTPGDKFRAVTVVCADSAAADALSTALFLSDMEAGRSLAESFGAEALWIAADGTVTYTDGFEALIKDDS